MVSLYRFTLLLLLMFCVCGHNRSWIFRLTVWSQCQQSVMPKAERARAPKAGPYSRLPLSLPAAGAMPCGRELWVGRGGQWTLGRVVRWYGEADDSSHWYELAFAEDEDISLCTAKMRRREGSATEAESDVEAC